MESFCGRNSRTTVITQQLQVHYGPLMMASFGTSWNSESTKRKIKYLTTISPGRLFTLNTHTHKRMKTQKTAWKIATFQQNRGRKR